MWASGARAPQRPVTFRDVVSEALEQRVTRSERCLKRGAAQPRPREANRTASAAGRLYSTYEPANSSLTLHTGVQVYFSEPAQPWQRGTNENTNSLQLQDFCQGAGLRAFRERTST